MASEKATRGSLVARPGRVDGIGNALRAAFAGKPDIPLDMGRLLMAIERRDSGGVSDRG